MVPLAFAHNQAPVPGDADVNLIVVDALDPLAGCAEQLAECTTQELSLCIHPTVPFPPVCGSDGLIEDLSFGFGEGHGAPAVTFQGASGCPTDVGAAAVFVLDAVHVDAAQPTESFVTAATTGWIDQAA